MKDLDACFAETPDARRLHDVTAATIARAREAPMQVGKSQVALAAAAFAWRWRPRICLGEKAAPLALSVRSNRATRRRAERK